MNLKKLNILTKNPTLYFVLCTIFLMSCGTKDPNSAGYEYMPDMYRSPSFETNGSVITANGDTIATNRLPVAGTISRGNMPYEYGNDTAGYGMAGRNLKNPLPLTIENLKAGEELYGKYCVHCHGASGAGDGLVSAKLPGAPPAYNGALKDLPTGKIFHSITYGKGLMGPHGLILNTEERWKLVYYVQKLQHPDRDMFAVAPVAVDSAKTIAKAEEKKKH